MKQKDLNKTGNKDYHMVTLSSISLRILSLYLSDYSKSFHVREIAKLLNTNHVSLIPHLEILNKEQILEFKLIGKNKVYFLNKSNVLLNKYLTLVEEMKSLYLLKSNLFFRKLFSELVSEDLIFILFGSYANNTYNSKSDIDLLVIGDLKEKTKKLILGLGKIYSKEFHLISLSKEKFEALDINNPFLIEVLKNHLILTETEYFTKIRSLKWKI